MKQYGDFGCTATLQSLTAAQERKERYQPPLSEAV